MQVFDADPTDAQLAVLPDPGGRSFSLRLEETPGQLTVLPAGYPLGLVVPCALLPLVAVAAYVAYQGMVDGLALGFLAFGCVAAPGLIGLICLLNRHTAAPG